MLAQESFFSRGRKRPNEEIPLNSFKHLLLLMLFFQFCYISRERLFMFRARLRLMAESIFRTNLDQTHSCIYLFIHMKYTYICVCVHVGKHFIRTSQISQIRLHAYQTCSKVCACLSVLNSSPRSQGLRISRKVFFLNHSKSFH